MWSSLAAAAAIISATVAIGAFLDQYSSDDTKSRLWRDVSGADKRKWTLSAVNIVVRAYEALFGGEIRSWKFFRRSVSVYAGILAVSMVFLGYFFPHVLASIISPYTFGNAAVASAALLLTVLGGLVFWVANAQTLYFLRLAQVDPRPTPVFLIFYADALLTTTICIVGVAILLWLQTAAYLQRGPQNITLELRVTTAAEALQENLRAARSRNPRGQANSIDLEIRQNHANLNSATTVFSRNVPSEPVQEVTRRDLELVDDLYKFGGASVRRIDDDTLQFIGPEGEVTSFLSQTEILRSEWHYSYESELTREQICRQFLEPRAAAGARYVVLDRISHSANWDLPACVSGRSGRITASVDINDANVDLQKLFALDVQIVFQHIVESVRTRFGDSGAIHPLAFIRPETSSSALVHIHMISEASLEGYNRLDSDFIQAYLAAEGVRAAVLNRSLPVGPIVTAIMATSLFTILLLVSACSAIMLAGLARMLGRMNGPLLIQRHPFVFVMLAGGLVSSLFSLIFLN